MHESNSNEGSACLPIELIGKWFGLLFLVKSVTRTKSSKAKLTISKLGFGYTCGRHWNTNDPYSEFVVRSTLMTQLLSLPQYENYAPGICLGQGCRMQVLCVIDE